MEIEQDLMKRYLKYVPRGYSYNGYNLPGIKRIEELEKIHFRPDDILLASFPKSGTSWLAEIVALVFDRSEIERTRIEANYSFFRRLYVAIFYRPKLLPLLLTSSIARFFSSLFALFFKSKKPPSNGPRIMVTHLPLQLLPKPVRNGEIRIICLTRNPKDTAVSFYHWHQFAWSLKLEWNDFFRIFAAGRTLYGSWFSYVRGYYGLRKKSKNVLCVKYEDLQVDSVKQVARICDFVGVPLTNERHVQIADHCQFKNMKQKKKEKPGSLPAAKQKLDIYMRKGKVGDWINQFTVMENEIFDEIYENEMKDIDEKYTFELDQTL